MTHERGDSQQNMPSHCKQEANDIERQCAGCPADTNAPKESAFKSLGWLDRLLALWILLAMVVGILLGNFVEGVGPALQKSEFVRVSIPIGKVNTIAAWSGEGLHANTSESNRSARHDVSHSLQGTIRNTAPCL